MSIDPLSSFAVKPVLRSLIFVRKCSLLFILFLKKNQQFITRGAMAVRGNYNVATYIENK